MSSRFERGSLICVDHGEPIIIRPKSIEMPETITEVTVDHFLTLDGEEKLSLIMDLNPTPYLSQVEDLYKRAV